MNHDNYQLDKLDYEILRLLQKNARLPYAQIAKKLDSTLGTIRNRVKKMSSHKIIRFWGRIDPHRVGFKTPANIHVSVQPSSLIDQVANQIAEFPEVSYVAIMTGEYDLEIDVWCRDQEHLTQLITDRLQKIEGVASTKTSLVLRVIKIANPDLYLIER